MTTVAPKIKYLTNKDLLHAIHESKLTFCSFVDNRYKHYDIIAHNLDSVTIDVLEAARQKKLQDMQTDEKKEHKNKAYESKLSLDDVPLNEIVVRLMTFEHIPINPAKEGKAKTVAEKHIRCQFPPFQHWVYDNNEWKCMGKSHWKGGMANGEFSLTHGRVTNRLGAMWMKLVERYGHRGNWRGYCVDQQTQALTKRGWLGIDEITTDDQILSYDQGQMKWSNIHSIYRGDFDGLLHKITVQGMDCLITPGHKKVTSRGLIPVEYLLESDHLILMGSAEDSITIPTYSDAFVELVGWIITEGCYEMGKNGFIKNITIYQNKGMQADRIRNCLTELGYKFSESGENKVNISFRIFKESSEKIVQILPEKNLNMNFINALTHTQRLLLLDTMIDGDGWRTQGHRRYTQKDPVHVAHFQTLCALLGMRTNVHKRTKISFNKLVSYYDINVFSTRKNVTKVSSLNFHGGKQNNRKHVGKGKLNHPNLPTEYYHGKVWCPQTDYGCFLARRNHTVYLTGNTYLDEMRAQALLQLSQVGLQFDESKSSNPFAYYTQCVSTSFLKILTTEKKSQMIRDDLLIMHNSTPSHTRQVEDQMAQRAAIDGPVPTASIILAPTGALL